MDLFGWDTVFVGAIETINQALARAGDGLIQTFTFAEDGISASGTFGAWSIVPGGSGQLLHLCFPIASGQFTPAPGMRVIDLAGTKVILQVPLRWLDAHARDARNLTFDLREVARKDSEDPAKISVVSVSPTNRLTPIQRSDLGYAIARYISAHAAQVSFILAAVDPAALGSNPWLRPAASAHAVVSPADGSAPAIAILSVVAVRDTLSLPRNVDAGLLPGVAANAAIAIASRLLISHIIAPAIARGLEVGPERFVVDGDGRFRSTGPIGMLSSVIASLTDARLSLSCTGATDLEAGVRMNFAVTCEFEVAILVPSHSLSFKHIGTTGTKSIEMDVGAKLRDFVRAILGGPKMEDRYRDNLRQASDYVLNKAQTGLAHSAPPPIDLGSVIWSGGAKFSPASGQVANALVVRGTLA